MVLADASSGRVFRHVQQVFAELEQHLEKAAGDPCQVKSVLGKLDGLMGAHVTAAMLKDEGWGHKLKALSKGGQREVAAAAKNVIAAWKQRICKELQ